MRGVTRAVLRRMPRTIFRRSGARFRAPDQLPGGRCGGRCCGARRARDGRDAQTPRRVSRHASGAPKNARRRAARTPYVRAASRGSLAASAAGRRRMRPSGTHVLGCRARARGGWRTALGRGRRSGISWPRAARTPALTARPRPPGRAPAATPRAFRALRLGSSKNFKVPARQHKCNWLYYNLI